MKSSKSHFWYFFDMLGIQKNLSLLQNDRPVTTFSEAVQIKYKKVTCVNDPRFLKKKVLALLVPFEIHLTSIHLTVVEKLL